MDAFRELLAPEVVMRNPEGWPEPGPFVGREAVMRQWEQQRDLWDTDALEPASDFIDAAEAHRIGLYNRVVPRDDLDAATREMLLRLARGPAEGLAATKDALNRETHADLEQALALESRIQADLMSRPDFKEGFAAFMEKRPPRFEGAPE
jgi:enoyl-CoA hydratase/carnithine racemase